MNEDTIDQFEAWLSNHYDPERTASGTVRTRKGVPVYSEADMNEVEILLGGSYGRPAIRRARAGDDVPARLSRAIRKIVELEDLDAIRRYRRDRELTQQLSHGIHIHNIGGGAPDGGSLVAWAKRARERMDERYQTEAPLGGEALEKWREIVSRAPANRRRQRRAA